MKKRPYLSVDAVVEKGGKILLVRRKTPPAGCWVLPGGLVDYGETVEEAIVREVKEETGLNVKIKKLLGVYSDPGRDSRRHSISVAFACAIVGGKVLMSTNETDGAGFFSPGEIEKMELGFDHRRIIGDFLKTVH